MIHETLLNGTRGHDSDRDIALKWVASEAEPIVTLLLLHLLNLEKYADLSEALCRLVYDIINLVKVTLPCCCTALFAIAANKVPSSRSPCGV